MIDQIGFHSRRGWFRIALFLSVFSAGALFAAMMTPVSAIAQEGVSIVTVDIQEVFQAHPAFADAQQQIQKEVAMKKKELDGMKKGDRQMAQRQIQQQLQQKNRQLQEEAFDKVQKDIRKIARQKGYDYVVNSDMMIAGGKDVTGEIMKALDLKQDSGPDQS